LIDDNNSCILKILKTYEEDRKTTDWEMGFFDLFWIYIKYKWSDNVIMIKFNNEFIILINYSLYPAIYFNSIYFHYFFPIYSNNPSYYYSF
jgi:hypothetical protein